MTPTPVSADFIGPNITYALAPGSDALPTGLNLSAAGFLSGTPTQDVSGRNIVIRGTNDQGSADSAFLLTVLEVLLNFTPTLTGLTANPTHGPSAQTGVELTAGATDFSGPTPGSIAFQWCTVESGPITGATFATYTPNAQLRDGETLYCKVTPDGYPTFSTTSHVIRQVPPVATGALWDDVIDLGSGPELYDVSGDFAGTGLVFSVTGPGTTIQPATGLLTIETNSPVAGAIITVAAMNSGGTAQSAFSLTVEDAGVGPGPDIGNPVLDAINDTIAFIVETAGTIYWRRDVTGTNPDATAVIAGGGLDSGSFPVASGLNAVDLTFAQGNDGVQEISFVAAATPGEPSLVQTVAIEIDTVDPVLSGMTPGAGTANAPSTVTPVLTFSEPVQAGSGVVTLFDVTGNTPFQVFDVGADAGTGPGQIAFSGDSVTLYPSTALTVGREYALLVDPSAVQDLSGNRFAGIASPAVSSFTVAASALMDTDFETGFTSAQAALWASMQANPYNATADHRRAETWDAYPASTTDGGIVGVKVGNYPQLRFSVPVEVGKTYTVDADLPVGEGGWTGPLRVKMGSAIDQADYAQIDETQTGQPRLVQVRGQQVTATSTALWFAVIVETGQAGATGGNPALSMLRVTEV